MAGVGLIDVTWRRKVPVLLQDEIHECGLVCLEMVGGFYGHDLDLSALRSRGFANRGMRVSDLVGLATAEGFVAQGLRLELEQLADLERPAILHWDLNHFVVLVAVHRRGIVIHDPAAGRRRLSWSEASRHVTGVVVRLRPGDDFVARDSGPRLKLGHLWQNAQGVAGGVGLVVILSLVLQATLIVAPLQVQWAIDQGVIGGDAELLGLLAMGFALVLLVRLATQLARGWLITRLTHLLAFEFARRLLDHVLRLPLEWFEKQQLGDITSRFGSLTPVRNALTQGLVTVVVDGVMALATVAMMFTYSATLALAVLAACTIYLIGRFAQLPRLKRATRDEIRARAQEETSFLESMRAIRTIRTYHQERSRLHRWQRHHANALNGSIQRAKVLLLGDAFNTLVFGLENILIVYLGATFIMQGALTIGMLFAFVSYKQHFTGHVIKLVEQLLDLKLLRVHLDRLADPCFTTPETTAETDLQPLTGVLELKGLGYRYGENDPWLLRDVELSIAPGCFVALIGPSGGGKTTLLKLLLGHSVPSEGEITVAGKPLSGVWLHRYRAGLGCVLQDDALFAGSIADNVTLFAESCDEQRLLAACRSAHVDEFVGQLPMGLQTLIGDMGAALSAGQVQRLLLARALYRNPHTLILDEGTANLDPIAKRRVHQVIEELTCTRVVVTHDLEFAKLADRVLLVQAGSVVELEAEQLGLQVA